MAKKIPIKVLVALDHVRGFYPEVTTVIFNKQGRWQYVDDDFDAPGFFAHSIDFNILQDAVDSVKSLPAVFQIEEE